MFVFAITGAGKPEVHTFDREDPVVLICADGVLACDVSPNEGFDSFVSTASLEEGSCVGALGNSGSNFVVETTFEEAITSDEEDGSAMAGAASSYLCDALGCSRAISIVAMVFSLSLPSLGIS